MAIFPMRMVYPHIANIVDVDLPNFLKNPRKLAALKKFGDFSDKEARDALRAHNPKITISLKELGPHVWGWYPGVDSTVFLSMTVADQYEELIQTWMNNHALSNISSFSSSVEKRKEAAKWKNVIIASAQLIEATIIHEIVHWGDENGLGQDGRADHQTKDAEAFRRGWADVGHMFVHEAYGKGIGFSHFRDRYGRSIRQTNGDVGDWLGWNKAGFAF